ncbi:hypothetical protein QOT17_000028 [Balamuthia mandrillaris]
MTQTRTQYWVVLCLVVLFAGCAAVGQKEGNVEGGERAQKMFKGRQASLFVDFSDIDSEDALYDSFQEWVDTFGGNLTAGTIFELSGIELLLEVLNGGAPSEPTGGAAIVNASQAPYVPVHPPVDYTLVVDFLRNISGSWTGSTPEYNALLRFLAGVLLETFKPEVENQKNVSASLQTRAVDSPSMGIGQNGATLWGEEEPSECFVGVGKEVPSGPPCNKGQPKWSQGSVSALAKSGNTLWWGSSFSAICGLLLQIETEFTPLVFRSEEQRLQFRQTIAANTGCEGVLSAGPTGTDFRPPAIYYRDIETGEEGVFALHANGSIDDPTLATALKSTAAMWSAGSMADTVYFIGGAYGGGINVFAFQSSSRKFMSWEHIHEFKGCRDAKTLYGFLYLACANNDDEGGSVIRLVLGEDPIEWTLVGILPTPAAYLAVFEDRIFVSTSPTTGSFARRRGELTEKDINKRTQQESAGVWMSPELQGDGLSWDDALSWALMWSIHDYEPDPIVAATTGGGPLAVHDGWLYWSTLHTPYQSYFAMKNAYPPDTPQQELLQLITSWRASALLRGKRWANQLLPPIIQTVYGQEFLPVYNPALVVPLQFLPSGHGEPVFGLSGFGNLMAGYIWSMSSTPEVDPEVLGRDHLADTPDPIPWPSELYLGTADLSMVAHELADVVISEFGGNVTLVQEFLGAFLVASGGDIWVMPSEEIYGPNTPAFFFTLDGLGDELNSGFPSMLRDRTGVYTGTSNQFSLLSGWQLWQLYPNWNPTP